MLRAGRTLNVVLAVAVFIAWGCSDQGIPDDVWEGSHADHEIRAVYGRTDCLGQLPIEHLGLPSALVELIDGRETFYVAAHPVPSPQTLDAAPTAFRLKHWQLWRLQDPSGSDEYDYVLVSAGGRPDPITYARLEQAEARCARSSG
jgi:hypothetical protein